MSSSNGLIPSNRLPRFQRATDYSGDYPAKLWLSRLESDFEESGYDDDIQIPPSLFIRAIEVLICGDAANKLLSNPRMSRIIDNRKSAKLEDVQAVKLWLQSQYPGAVQPIYKGSILEELRELSQVDGETLEAYFERAMELLRYTGSRDQLIEENGDSVPESEVCMRNVVAESFVRGIREEELREYVLDHADVGVLGLRKTYEATRNGARFLETRHRIARERQERNQVRTLEEEVKRMTEETKRVDAYFSNMGVSAAAVRSGQHQYQYTASIANCSGSRPQHEISSQIPRNNTSAPPQGPRRNFNQGKAIPPLGPRSQLDPRGAMTSYNIQDHSNHSGALSSNFSNQKINQNQGQPTMQLGGNYPALKPRSDSRHPIINGSETFDPSKDGLLCTRCGVKGHAKPACRNEALPYWERAYLNEKVNPRLSATSHLLALTKEEDATGESYRQWGTPLKDRGGVLTLEEFADVSQPAECASRAVEIGTMMCKAVGHENDDLAAANIVEVMAAKRRRVVEEEHENDYETRETRGGSGKAKKAGMRQLKTIVGRQGQGPMNYLELARRFKVDMNLLELMQVSPEVTRQFKRAGTRESTRKARGNSRKKEEADILPKTQGKKQTSEGSVEANAAGHGRLQ
ncbi:hypothetical protein HI914_05181 [Erysiphe necator]|nr:hypothetical protein HI914_05181 [Erysiphe necator]